MQNINSDTELRAAIVYLESKHHQDYKALKVEFKLAQERVNPSFLLRHALKETAEILEIKENFMITTVGISAGLFSKYVVVGNSRSPLRKLLGAVFTIAITNLAARNSETLNHVGVGIKNLIFKLGNSKMSEKEFENDEIDVHSYI
jgi:hypothetical protein